MKNWELGLKGCTMNEILHIWMKYMRRKDEELIKIGNGMKLQNV
jgi:hypothetical protein